VPNIAPTLPTRSRLLIPPVRARSATAACPIREKLRTAGQRSIETFLRGEFDTGVFQAMKAVEVAVREAAGLTPADIGKDLMRKALEVRNGPLTDMTAEPAERQARSDLFAGAIRSYKNPHSHRDVRLDDPAEAS
jgi:uncharacterized protein (TIGR02391 family)